MADPEHLARLEEGLRTWNEWRDTHRNIRPNLVGADLFKADFGASPNWPFIDFNDAYMGGADLSGADLTNANLREANLLAATLTGANLTKANLTGANLIHANLGGANLTGAHIYGATFTETTPISIDFNGKFHSGADFHDARMGRTTWGNIDLSLPRGLDTIAHLGPSFIDINTLSRSKGKIPEVFLRGAGVPEDFITYMKSLVGRPFEFYSCFISYNHTDQSFARRLHDQLQARGIRCWLDEHQMLPGDNIFEQVDRGIRFWDKVLLCCSQASLTSWWVNSEINKAFVKEQQLMKNRGTKVLALIPLNLDNFLLQWTNGIADEVKSRLAADFTGWKRSNAKFEEQFERVVRALRADDGAREAAPVSKL